MILNRKGSIPQVAQSDEVIHYYFKPRFAVHLLVCLIHLIIFFMGMINNNWPRYCEANMWASFAIVGIHISGLIISGSTFFTNVLFEDLNWVLMTSLLTIYAFFFLLLSSLYMQEVVNGCQKCRIPYMKLYSSDAHHSNATSAFQDDDLYISKESLGIEWVIIYLTLILGFLYVIFILYISIRRAKG